MTAKEKAEKLYDEMNLQIGSYFLHTEQIKHFVNVCIKEVQKAAETGIVSEYWEEVKKEVKQF